MQGTVLDLFKKVESITNRKIDTMLEDIKHLPDIPMPPGMDLTAGGEYLTNSEFEKIKTTYPVLVQEREALSVAFAGVNALVMNKLVFYDLTQRLDLFRIYPSPSKDGYYHLLFDRNEWGNYQRLNSIHAGKLESLNEKRKRLEERKKSIFNAIGTYFSPLDGSGNEGGLILFFIWILPFILVGRGIYSLTESFLLSGAGIAVLTYLMGLFFQKIAEKRLPVVEQEIHRLNTSKPEISVKKLIPGLIIRDMQTSTIRAKVNVVPPPPQTRERITRILTHIPKGLAFDICTVADPLSIEITDITPIPQTIDPGVVIEYGHFAVILTDTFYYVSNLEQYFLDEAMTVAEKWEVKKYLLN